MSEEQEEQSTNDSMNQSIIQVQFLNYLMNNNTVSPILEFGIDEKYFPGYEKEFNYLTKFWNDSKIKDGKGTMPDKVRFAYDFPDFPLFETVNAVNTLFSQLHEQRCYALFVEVLQTSAEKSKTSSFEAIEYGKAELDKLFKFANNTLGNGKDLIRGANERLDDYIKRVELHGLLGIKTGDQELDKYLHGWLPEDFVVIIARTNEGKSWLLLYYMIQAILQGKKVGMYSGEMSQLMMGFRFDTLYKQFGNSQLIGGDPSLGDNSIPEVGAKAMKEYQDYISALLKGDLPELRVFTQKDLGSRMSVNKMRILQEKHGFDIWGLDQLTLMDDDRKGKDERIRLSDISEDCFGFSEDYQVPVLTVHQAGRKAAEAKKKDENAAPTIEDAFGADAIIQNATRAMAFTQIENGAKCANIKNRYGQRGKEFLYVWNINYGVFKPLDQQSIKDNLF
jgi:replicative DNA helicase